jgi:hypothetical protein
MVINDQNMQHMLTRLIAFVVIMLYVYQVLVVTETCEIKSIHYTEDCVMCIVASERKENFPLE